MTTTTMPDSYYRTLLMKGKNEKLQELADLASRNRTPSEAKRVAEEAQNILRDLAELDEKLLLAIDGPGGLDYREDLVIYVSIIKYLTAQEIPASEDELTKELIRGQFPGYKNERLLAIRVGRCVRAYTSGAAKVNPKLKYRNRLVGLPGWSDKMFS